MALLAFGQVFYAYCLEIGGKLHGVYLHYMELICLAEQVTHTW